jgi:ATP-dependent protease ClpP protease subunit
VEYQYTINPYSEKPVMMIDKHIGYLDGEGYGIMAGQFQREMQMLIDNGATEIEIRMNSIGGQVFEGMGIFNAIEGAKNKCKIKMMNIGLVASIAAVIFQAGDEREMADYALMMIHGVQNAEGELEQKATESLVTMLCRSGKRTREEVMSLMQDDNWMTAAECLEAGFCSSITGGLKGITNAVKTYNDYPKAATENAKRALKYAEENGWGDCGTPVGKKRASQLANRESLTRDTIARMAAFERHRQNSDTPYGEGCGKLMWDAWGGDEGIAWAQKKLKQIDGEMASSIYSNVMTITNSMKNQSSNMNKQITNSLGLQEGAAEDIIAQAINALKEKSVKASETAKSKEAEIGKLTNKVTELTESLNAVAAERDSFKSKVETAEAEVLASKVADVITNAVTLGKIADTDEAKATWSEKLVNDFDGTNALLNAIPVAKKAPGSVTNFATAKDIKPATNSAALTMAKIAARLKEKK